MAADSVKIDTKYNRPIRPNPWAKVVITPAEYARLRNSEKCTSGSAVRASASTNTTPEAIPNTATPSVSGPVQPQDPPCCSTTIAAIVATPRLAAPTRSGRAPDTRSRTGNRKSQASTPPTANNSRSAANSQRQPTVSAKAPPYNGPTAKVKLAVAAQIPTAVPCLASGNTRRTRASCAGSIRPDAMPWKARPTTRTSGPGAAAIVAEPTANRPRPIANILRRPSTSPNCPPAATVVAAASR